MRFVARSGLPTGWNGRGAGAVVVERPTAEIIIFHESGVWQPQGDGEVDFSNIFRWSKVEPQTIRLEHLRYGPEQPVYLFDLAAGSDGEWHSVRPHLCRADVYAARLWYDERFIFMAWTITGPKKQETIEYAYSW
jgi:hypothetical protein